MVRQSQIDAKNNYEKKNPVQAFYWQKKSSARGFISPKPSTKLYRLLQNNVTLKNTYISDLQDFKLAIENTLKRLKG